jgi:hypothetical protein
MVRGSDMIAAEMEEVVDLIVMLAAVMMGFRRRSGLSWPVCAVRTCTAWSTTPESTSRPR